MKWLLLVLILPILLSAGALLANRPPLLDPPGPLARLQLYLTTNVAQTELEPALHELRPLPLKLTRDAAIDQVMIAMRELGWTEINRTGDRVRAVVSSRWLKFKDDVEVWLESREDAVLVQARSASRVGKGDLAANARHILDLFDALGEWVVSPDST
ncbi:MAG: DUF1499 domain-containing protein [Gammaproteobacteria bacterium]|nr:DUF1499 domain-containing protein [Gammaproteobacteria bacterium]